MILYFVSSITTHISKMSLDLPDIPKYFLASALHQLTKSGASPDTKTLQNKYIGDLKAYLEEVKDYQEKVKLLINCLEGINKSIPCRVDITRIPTHIVNDVSGNLVEAGYKTTIKNEVVQEIDHFLTDADDFRLGSAGLKYHDVTYTFLYINSASM